MVVAESGCRKAIDWLNRWSNPLGRPGRRLENVDHYRFGRDQRRSLQQSSRTAPSALGSSKSRAYINKS